MILWATRFLGAGAQICNFGSAPSGLVRVRLLAINRDGILGNEGTFTPDKGVAPDDTLTIPIGGACPPATLALAVLEEQLGGEWFFRDACVANAAVGQIRRLCFLLVGGGVALLETLRWYCFCPPRLMGVQISGPPT